MRFQFFHDSAASFAKSVIGENSTLMGKYVRVGLRVVSLAIQPVDFMMKHLLAVQNLDPNTIPGLKAHQEFMSALNSSLDQVHENDYDADYDFSWLHKKWEETNSRLGDKAITKQKFVEMTDVSKLGNLTGRTVPPVTIDHSEDLVNQIAPESEKKELPLDSKEGRQQYREKVLNEAKDFFQEQERENLIEVGGNAIDALRDALYALEKELVEKKPIKGSAVKTERANKLIDDMIKRGLVTDTDVARSAQLEEVLQFDDEAFEALERVVAKHQPIEEMRNDPNKFKGSFRRKR